MCLLLDRWLEYSEFPRLKRLHLLHVVVTHVDMETIMILRHTDHLRLQYDDKYTLGDFATRFPQRADVTGKLVLAFEELLGVIREGPPAPPSPYHSEISKMEAGLAGRDDEDEEDVFENALESLHSGKEKEVANV